MQVNRIVVLYFLSAACGLIIFLTLRNNNNNSGAIFSIVPVSGSSNIPKERNVTLFNEINSPGVFIEPHNGLGNQLFHFACAYALSKTLKVPLYIKVDQDVSRDLQKGTVSPLRHSQLKSTKERPFALDLFPNIPLEHILTSLNTSSVNLTLTSKVVSDEQLLNISLNLTDTSDLQNLLVIHRDSCQSENFFYQYRNEIKRMFRPDYDSSSLSALKWKQRILNVSASEDTIPVGIHIRRGDYTMSAFHYFIIV